MTDESHEGCSLGLNRRGSGRAAFMARKGMIFRVTCDMDLLRWDILRAIMIV